MGAGWLFVNDAVCAHCARITDRATRIARDDAAVYRATRSADAALAGPHARPPASQGVVHLTIRWS